MGRFSDGPTSCHLFKPNVRISPGGIEHQICMRVGIRGPTHGPQFEPIFSNPGLIRACSFDLNGQVIEVVSPPTMDNNVRDDSPHPPEYHRILGSLQIPVVFRIHLESRVKCPQGVREMSANCALMNTVHEERALCFEKCLSGLAERREHGEFGFAKARWVGKARSLRPRLEAGIGAPRVIATLTAPRPAWRWDLLDRTR